MPKYKDKIDNVQVNNYEQVRSTYELTKQLNEISISFQVGTLFQLIRGNPILSVSHLKSDVTLMPPSNRGH